MFSQKGLVTLGFIIALGFVAFIVTNAKITEDEVVEDEVVEEVVTDEEVTDKVIVIDDDIVEAEEITE